MRARHTPFLITCFCTLASYGASSHAAPISHDFISAPKQQTVKVKFSGYCTGSFIATAKTPGELTFVNGATALESLLVLTLPVTTLDGFNINSTVLGFGNTKSSIKNGKVSAKATSTSMYSAAASVSLPAELQAATTCKNGLAFADFATKIFSLVNGKHSISLKGKDGVFSYNAKALSKIGFDISDSCTESGNHNGDITNTSGETYSHNCKLGRVLISISTVSKGDLTP